MRATCASTSSPARCASGARGTASRRTPRSCRTSSRRRSSSSTRSAALDPDDATTDEALIEELGDLLYQIEFHATVAEQQGRFTIADVTAGIHDKLVRRHPHVFGDVEAHDAGTVVANWEDIKRDEKGRTSVFDGVARSLPALAYAQQLMGKAAKVGFDWPDVEGPLAKVDEELGRAARGDRRG